MDEETGLYYYGARYYKPRESVWLSVDPLAEKYPSVSPYVYTFNNPVVYVDPDGNEGVPVSVNSTRFPWPSISKHQWYVVGGRPDARTFNSAAVYNTTNNNTWAYKTIKERHQYYSWVDNQVGSK